MFFNNLVSLLNHGAKGLMQKTSTFSPVRRKSFGTTKQRNAAKFGPFFVYSDQQSSSLFGTFLSFEDKNLFFFSLFKFSLLLKTKHAAYLVYAERVTFWIKRKLMNKKNASSANSLHPGGHDRNASTQRHCPPLLFYPVFIFPQPPLYSALSLYKKLKSGKDRLQLQSCTLTLLMNWPQVSLYVWLVTGRQTKQDALVFSPSIL